MRLTLSRRAKISGLCLLGAAGAVGLVALGTQLAPPATSAVAATTSADVPAPSPTAEPEPVKVPSSASGARSSGMGGQSWMSGSPAQLGADFKRSVAHQFGNGTLGQAHMAMTGLGFQCAVGAGGMDCEKSLKADNCTLTWSVSLRAAGADVRGAGGEGFSRDCT